MTFAFSLAPNRALAANDVQQLRLDTLAFEASERDRQAEAEKERVFRVWQAFLRAKGDFEERRQNAITYVAARRAGRHIVLTAASPVPADLGEGSRLIHLPNGGRFFCDIVEVNLDEVVVVPTYGDMPNLPQRGLLEINTIAAERAIERQRRALSPINSGGAANPRLKGIIVDPNVARHPTVGLPPLITDTKFDDEKKAILSTALGLQDLLAIEGPPGTGKTRLIEEIVVRYLESNPGHRVLISSQTHVALDNVISRIRARQSDLEIIRVGKLDDQKIAPESRDLIVERRTIAWSEGVRKRAHDYLRNWADSRGLAHSDIELGVLIEKLCRLLETEAQIKSTLTRAAETARAAKEEIERKVAETGSSQASEDTEAKALEAESTMGATSRALTPVRQGIVEVREKLRSLKSYGPELADVDDVEELSYARKLVTA